MLRKLCSSFLPLPSADPADSLSVLLTAGNPPRAGNAALEHPTPVAEETLDVYNSKH